MKQIKEFKVDAFPMLLMVAMICFSFGRGCNSKVGHSDEVVEQIEQIESRTFMMDRKIDTIFKELTKK